MKAIITTKMITSLAISTNQKKGHDDDIYDDLSQDFSFSRSDDISQLSLSSSKVSSTRNNSISIKKNSASCEGQQSNSNYEFDDSIRTSETPTASTYPLHETTATHATTSQHDTRRSSAGTIISIGSSTVSNKKSALEGLKPNLRKSNDLSGFTINKLKFSSLGIYGRDEEISIIQKAFEECFLLSSSSTNTENKGPSNQQIGGKRHLICISGTSGTGKSKLVDPLEIPTKKVKGLLVRGKFDLNLRNEPYFAFSRAYSEICSQILEKARNDPEASLRIRNDIKDSLQSELALLTQVVPALAEIIDIEQGNKNNTNDNTHVSNQNESMLIEDSRTNPSVSSMSSDESKNRFHYAFLRFTRVISSHFKSFVIVLDDLQWADASSLELLRILISDYENPYLLIIGTYRSDEVANNPSHILLKTIGELQSKCKKSSSGADEGTNSFQLTQIHLEDLGIDSVHKIIQDLLSTASNDERALKLAGICYKKTNGNVFYLLNFLGLLTEHNLLKFNFGTVSWTWDENEIESNTSAATNVVDLLLSRINLLPPNLIELMKLASCLGYEFEVQLLQLVWQKWADIVSLEEEKNEESLSKELERLKQEGFIVESRTNKVVSSYRWAHDKIQEACLSLIPKSDRGSYNRRIGKIFLEGLKGDDFYSNILILVDLLNGGLDGHGFQSSDESLRLAHLNLQAGRKALSMSSFENAAVYAGYGIRLLPSNSWKEHYHLSLELYSLGAKAEGAIGNVETMNKFCHIVLSQENIPTIDKFDVYNTWVDSIIARGYYQEAIDILLSILREFKCTFPKNKMMIGLSLVKQIVKLELKTKSKDFSKLKEMNDTTMYELMRFIDKLSLSLYLVGDDRMSLVFFRGINWSMKYGFCEYSPLFFAAVGMMLTGILEDLKGGARFGEQFLELMRTQRTSAAKAKLIFMVHAYLLVWTKPAGEMIKPLFNAYEMGLQTGDTENAMWAIFASILIRFLLGSSLESLEADALMYSRQAEALKRDHAIYMFKMTRQAFLNLMGQDNIEDPTQMIGNSLDEKGFEYCKHNKLLLPIMAVWTSILSSYFGNHVELVDSYELEFSSKVHVASSLHMRYYLHSGVSFFAYARKTGKKKYAKIGQSILSKFKKWVERGNPNIHHLVAFLEAELMAVNKKNTLARKSYENSILMAARSGFQHDAAFASERYGRFCLDIEKDIDEGSYRICEAIKYWESWGALAKVRSLKAEFSDLVQQKPSQIFL